LTRAKIPEPALTPQRAPTEVLATPGEAPNAEDSEETVGNCTEEEQSKGTTPNPMMIDDNYQVIIALGTTAAPFHNENSSNSLTIRINLKHHPTNKKRRQHRHCRR
jgi:hypothetical protein